MKDRLGRDAAFLRFGKGCSRDPEPFVEGRDQMESLHFWISHQRYSSGQWMVYDRWGIRGTGEELGIALPKGPPS